MTPKYYQTPVHTRDRWMISYLDVLTILLILFLRVAADSLPHAPKVEAAPMPVVQPTPPVPPVPEKREHLVRAQEVLRQHGLDPRLEARGLVISIPQAVLFAPGDDRVHDEALPLLSQVADALRGIPNPVRLVGHADAVPIHNRRFRDNWELSTARGLRILEVLSQQYGLEESRLSIASYGSYQPSGPNDTTDGRAQNRRVEILILDEGSYLEVQPDK